MASPALLVIAIVSIIPLLAAVVLSFTRYDIFSVPKFVGLENYRSLFADPVFWTAVGNTGTFAFSQVVVGMVVVVLVALLLNQNLRGGAAMRTIVYVPQAASYVVVALAWNLLLDPVSGPLSQVVTGLTGHSLAVLTSSSLAMPAIVVVSLWRNIGYFMVIVLAALQTVPRELLEAATVDGAGAVRRFFSVTVPNIAPALMFVAITWFLGSLQMFTQSYVMTQGGPVNATRTVVYVMYNEAFLSLNVGKASAIAVLLFGTVVVIAGVLRLIQRRSA
ncbi:sugar ABC transporter permease [Microbacterium sp. Au-Mic1]|uniref:carbohydrate ABC transporter permease n=1 Tax=Microbacterium sp. Au-Mic1 TaxID=2906457 RepID=UPI001E338823|nr:sugar ABC transporter permease [Microbacterium sp. Au-Mic1]MCE4026247.1 sugar ABC transporter permease [Microbacterium sp. Au-Mic1]